MIVPGQPDESLLVRAIRYKGDTKMPPKKPLPAESVETLTEWIKLGAPWPDSSAGGSAIPGGVATIDAKRHWGGSSRVQDAAVATAVKK